MIAVQSFADFDALTDIGRPLLNAEHRGGVFLGEAWFRTVLAHAMPPDTAPLFLLAMRGDHPIGLRVDSLDRRVEMGDMVQHDP